MSCGCKNKGATAQPTTQQTQQTQQTQTTTQQTNESVKSAIKKTIEKYYAVNKTNGWVK